MEIEEFALILQLIRNQIDFGITPADFRTDVGRFVDYTNYVYINEVMFNVCFPKAVKGTYNIVRPFG